MLMNKVIQLNEKVFFYEDYNAKILAELEVYREKDSNEVLNTEHLKTIIWKKDDTISAQTLMIDTLSIKIQEF